MSRTAFESYAPFIQQYIYRKGWTDLKDVQKEACDAILNTNDHVIIASGTASGKTEAAFFPILTILEKTPSKSIGVLYICPLKALINDQFQRLNELLEESDIPVFPWHGDVSQALKNRALREMRGILQITPESLESLLMSRSAEAKQLFSDLKFVVIDEIHAFMGTDRGLQVICLLARLEGLTKLLPRRIGLSATLNDYNSVKSYLSAGTERIVQAIGIQAQKKSISLCVESFILPNDEKKAEPVMHEYNQFLYDFCHLQKCLIYTNSRGKAEKTIMDMKIIAEMKNEKDIFYVHHGSISAALRNETETALRENNEPTVAAATLTLELGIDIGDLDSTIQIGAPYTCSSFVQRLGRSGRRSNHSKMLFVNLYEEDIGNPFDCLPWELLRAIAVIQLYMEERWVEPFTLKPKPFSLLVHQTLSILMTYVELLPSDLARKVLSLPVFKENITQDEYRELLRNMIETEMIELLDSGKLIVGLNGEKLTNHYTFYSVFIEPLNYVVYEKNNKIGSLDSCPEVDSVFALAGRSWKIQSVDRKKMNIYVIKVNNSKAIPWKGMEGSINTRIVERIKKVLYEDDIYTYLRPNAVKLLKYARDLARTSEILNKAITEYTGKYILHPWVGTKELNTIRVILSNLLKDELQISKIETGYHNLIITSRLTLNEIIDKINKVNKFDIDSMMAEEDVPNIDKYDEFVPENLLRKAYLHNELDVSKALEILRQIIVS